MKSMRLRGSTLIEFLLYFALLGILMLAATKVILSVLDGKAKLDSIDEVSENGRFALDRIALAVRNADVLVLPATGTSGGYMSLIMPTASSSPTSFGLSGGVLQMKEGTSASTSLTTDDVTVSGLTFQNLTATDAPGTVQVQMTVSSTNAQPSLNYGLLFLQTTAVRKRL
jgi:Tfp pilus assembly protein PilW